MDLEFPIVVEEIKRSSAPLEEIPNSRFSLSHIQVNEDSFYLNVHGVASYTAHDGNYIQYFPHAGADKASVKLFLNGSVLGAILHQRGNIPFHGSSFQLDGKGILICGVSGAGKSSVTAAFCRNGAKFINDDITPVDITQKETTIIPIKTRIKLWDDSLKKLEIENIELEKIRPALEKFYLPSEETFSGHQKLDHIFILHTRNNSDFESVELEGMVKFNFLRKQIYRKMYLKGMPETEKKYFKQLFMLGKNVRVTSVLRPQLAEITSTMAFIKQQLM